MTRLLALMTVVLGLATYLAAAQEPQFRSAAHTVSVYATVLDRAGRLVPDLTRDDFQVFDNGKPQDVTLFANAVQPITIVIMLDRSGSMASNFDLVKDAAQAFVANLLPDDRARIGSFADRIRIDPEQFTSDQVELKRILNHELLPAGATPLWRATALAMDALSSQEGRRVVLMFTDGKDSPEFGHIVSFAEVERRSQTEEIMVYGIGFSEACSKTSPSWRPRYPGGILFQRRGPGQGIPGGPIGRPGLPRPGIPTPGGPQPGMPQPGLPPTRFPPVPPYGGWPPTLPPVDPGGALARGCSNSGPDPDLRALAAVGGGGYFELHDGDNLRSTFARVAEELHHQYLLAFSPATLDNRLHQLEVRVKNANLSTRARRTYFAGSEK